METVFIKSQAQLYCAKKRKIKSSLDYIGIPVIIVLEISKYIVMDASALKCDIAKLLVSCLQLVVATVNAIVGSAAAIIGLLQNDIITLLTRECSSTLYVYRVIQAVVTVSQASYPS